MELNKYQEALNFFKKVAHHVPLKSATDEFCEEYDGNLNVLKELVDKATPKKVKNKEDHYVFDTTEYSHTCGKCPNCKELVYYCDGYNQDAYCSKCGQKLDWSKE